MGAGKSTIGRQLADQLGMEFRDVDHEVEARAGVDIPWIFDREGEAGFRQRESSVLADLASMDRVVIATGGGAVLAEDNRRIMSNTGTVIYLSSTLNELLRRTSKDRKRPLLQTDSPRTVLKNIMLERGPLYEAVADIAIQTDGRGPRWVVTELAKRLRDPAQLLQ